MSLRMPPFRALFLGALVCLGLAATARVARADRYFPFSYPYNTDEQGERELELYSDVSASGLENRLEFELYPTDRLALAASGYLHNGTQFDGWALEGRYRLAEPDVLPLDTALYGEIEDAQGEGPTLEYKLLLEKTFGEWEFDANLIGEHHFRGGDEFGATLAGGYFFDENTIAGIEARYDAQKLYAGPTWSRMWGPYQLTAGVYYGGADALLGRLVLAQEL
ncbi:MAG TPA: hypothetical protein V6D47_00115 [Oscillatoriaceae cyanobacterium]